MNDVFFFYGGSYIEYDGGIILKKMNSPNHRPVSIFQIFLACGMPGFLRLDPTRPNIKIDKKRKKFFPGLQENPQNNF